MQKNHIMGNREIERQLIEFTEKLKTKMSPAEIVKLYDEVEQEHWLSESKVLLMRTIFHSVLQEEEQKSAPPMPDDVAGIFR